MSHVETILAIYGGLIVVIGLAYILTIKAASDA